MDFSFKNRIVWLPLVVILIVAAIFRFYNLANNPPSLNWDEASLGYNAYSILKTGHDEWGKTMPLTFRAFGDYKLPGYVYLDVPSVAIFGLNELGARFPSAFFGALTVGLVYLLLLKILSVSGIPNQVRNRSMIEEGSLIRSEMAPASDDGTIRWKIISASFGAGLLAISPWHVFVSRSALEANVALFFIVLGVFLFILGISHGKRQLANGKMLVASMIAFGISIFTYNSARVFVPLFVIVLLFFFMKRFFQQQVWAYIAIVVFAGFFALSIPLAIIDSSARYEAVTILDQGAINRIDEARGASTLPSTINRLVHNKLTYFVVTTAENYPHYFSPNFLFVRGGSQYQFSLPNFGLLYIIELPLVFFGLYWFWRTRNRTGLLVAFWMLLAPIPAAITRETPHVLRSLFLFPTFEILSAFGFLLIMQRLRSKSKELVVGFLIFLIAIVVIQGALYYRNYFTFYPVQYACTWQAGYKQMSQYVYAHQHDYNRIIMTKKYGEPQIFYLFYNRIDPNTYVNDPNLVRYEQSNWYWVDRFQNIDFVNDWELQQKIKDALDQNVGKMLVVTSPNNYPRLTKPFTTVLFPNGQPVFDLLQLDSNKQKLSQDDVGRVPPERGCYGT